jgi:4-hydroxybenzoate polyprenyltransferase
MACLQFAIGALNDVADAPRDGGRQPPKPIPAGLIRRPAAAAIGGGAAIAGLVLSIPSGPAVAAVATAGLACGLAYDLALSRTSISWLPLTIALPLVPVYAWLGATGTLPAAVAAILPAGALAGGGLALGNALVDLEADRAAGRATVAVALGRRPTLVVHALALGLAALVVAILLPGGRPGAMIAVTTGGIVLAIGLATMAWPAAARRRIAWQIEAAGVAILGVGWVVAAAGGT